MRPLHFERLSPTCLSGEQQIEPEERNLTHAPAVDFS